MDEKNIRKPKENKKKQEFYTESISRIYTPASNANPFAHPSTPVLLRAGDPDSAVNVQWKTKVIKLVIQPNSNRVSQIDSVAILGFSVSSLNRTGECPGATSVPTGNGRTIDVMCNGNGVCRAKGCECKGNWDGADCGNCKFGWAGEDCEVSVVRSVPAINFCAVAMFEDLQDFEGDTLEIRWMIQDYTFRSSRVMRPRHFGTKFVSPQITLGDHSHVRIQSGFFIMDMPRSEDSGVISRVARRRTSAPGRDRTETERQEDGERVIYLKRAPYVTGVNVIGSGKGDTSDQMDITTSWDSSTLSVEFEIWSPDIADNANRGNHRFTLTYFIVESCTYPSQSGTDNPDTELN